MKKILLTTIVLFGSSFVSQAQSESSQWLEKFSQCHNGVKDSAEDGVDCYTKGSLQGCPKCNGQVSFTINRKQYTTSVVPTSNLGLNGKSTMLQIMPRIYTDGTETGGLMLSLSLRLKSFEEGTYKLVKTEQDGLGRFWGYTVSVNFNMLGLPKGISKVDKGSLTISKLDKLERLVSGSFNAYGTLDDGTPIELEGTFTNVAFD